MAIAGLLAPVSWIGAVTLFGRGVDAALGVLRWHRTRFAGESDERLDEGDLQGAEAALPATTPGSDWARFERARLEAQVAIATGNEVNVEGLRVLSGRLEGRERVRSLGAIGLVEALIAAAAGKSWVGGLATLRDDLYRQDWEVDVQQRRRWLIGGIVVTGAAAAAFAGILVIAGMIGPFASTH